MSRAQFRRLAVGALSLSTVGVAASLFASPANANPAGDGLVISEAYVNGGSTGATYLNKFLELFNPTSSAINLSGDSLQYRAPTSTVVPSGSQVFGLTGTVAPHGHFLIQLPGNGAASNPGAPLPAADLSTGGSVNPGAGGGTLFIASGTSGVLPTDPAVIDKIGWGTSNSPEKTAPTGNSLVLSYQRAAAGTDTDDNGADFTVATPAPQNAAGDGGATTVSVTNPGTQNGVEATALTPITLKASGGSGAYTWQASGLPTGLTLSDAGVISGTPAQAGNSTVTVTATDGAGAKGSATFTFEVSGPAQRVSIAQIQGTNTDTSPYAGQTVTTDGVVTAAYPSGGFSGFFVETPGADTTPGASDAVFVFGSISAAQVSVGESVRVTGKVSEFQGETEISGPTVTKLDDTRPRSPRAPCRGRSWTPTRRRRPTRANCSRPRATSRSATTTTPTSTARSRSRPGPRRCVSPPTPARRAAPPLLRWRRTTPRGWSRSTTARARTTRPPRTTERRCRG